MKKVVSILVLMATLLTLVSCSAFNRDVHKFIDVADYKDGKVIFINEKDLQKNIDKTVKDLIKEYPGTKDIKEGKIKKDQTVYIYYEGTLVIFDGDTTMTVGASGIKGFDEALKKAEFKDGKATFKVKLASDFTVPQFVTDALKKPDADKDKDDKDKKDGDAVSAGSMVYADNKAPSSNKNYFAEKETTFTVEIKDFKGIKDGDKVEMKLRWTLPGFEGGTYNKKTEDDNKKKEEADKKPDTKPSTSKEEEKRPGYALKIGSKSFIEGFEDGLIGVSVEKDTKKLLELTFPNPYKNNPALSGMRVDFDVTILSVTEDYDRNLDTEWDDLKEDYEKKNGKDTFDFKDKAAYLANVEKTHKEEMAMKAMLKASKVKKWPLKELDKYYASEENQVYQYYYMMSLYGYIGKFNSLEELAKQLGVTYDAFKQDISNKAGAALKKDLILYHIAKEEGLDKVSDEEYDKYVKKQAEDAGYVEKDKDGKVTSVNTKDYVDAIGGKKEVCKWYAIEKAYEFLGANITIVK